ncbi:MAG: acetylglutamate kinase [Flavobacteriales bacterium]|nr:acetylglutamate kinase [Flavobacteriales bacterium]
MKTKLQIIKIGGHVIDDASVLDQFLVDFAHLDSPKILVHGGGKIATKLSEQLGIKTKINEGRRITSKENLEVVTMVYAGLINTQITAQLQAKGCNAIGLSGADANTILAEKRAVKPIDFGEVGDVKKINTSVIHSLLSTQLSPVFCAISHDGNGNLLNTNADTVAAELAIALNNQYDTELIYCFEKKGVLANIDQDKSFIPQLTVADFDQLKTAGLIYGGVLPKIENCFHALRYKVQKVRIGGVGQLKKNTTVFTAFSL